MDDMREETLNEYLPLQQRPIYEFTKRIFDILFASIGFVLFMPLMIVIAAAVKINSPGPIIYKGIRTGRNGNDFNIYKFRSMVVGADKGARTTSRNDERVTSVGRFIRKNKLDELPQLVNIIKGEMSFVGPRPELPCYTKQYHGKELLILTVTPGLTDYSSLHYSNLNHLIGDIDPDAEFESQVLQKKNELRIEYVETRGFLADIILIVKTVLRVLNLV